MTTGIIVHGVEELEKVVTQSGLEKSEGDLVKENYLPFLERLAKVKEQSTKINTENPTLIDEKIARELRLETVDIRKRCEDVKDSRKKIHLLKGNLEQASFNLIKADCLLIEEAFTQVEKAREIAEKKRKAELKIARIELLQPLTEVINPEFVDLENMTEDAFQLMVDGAKLQIQAKRDAEKKAEEERLAAIEAERKRQEEIRLENERLKKEAEEKEKARIEFAKNKKTEAIDFLMQVGFESDPHGMSAKNYKHFIGENHYSQFENENEFESFKENVLKTKQLEEERTEAEAKLKAEQEKSRKEMEAKEAERKKLEAELKAKQDAELAEKKRIEAEAKTKADAEAKLAKAGDKKRLQVWIGGIELAAPNPEGMKPESIMVLNDIQTKHAAFIKWAMDQINSL